LAWRGDIVLCTACTAWTAGTAYTDHEKIVVLGDAGTMLATLPGGGGGGGGGDGIPLLRLLFLSHIWEMDRGGKKLGDQTLKDTTSSLLLEYILFLSFSSKVM